MLAVTAVFLLILCAMHVKSQRQTGSPAVFTEVEVPQEELQLQWEPTNINTADAEELMRLPGIGEVLAAAIVEYREANGPITDVRTLLEVPGIGEGKLAAIVDQITVE